MNEWTNNRWKGNHSLSQKFKIMRSYKSPYTHRLKCTQSPTEIGMKGKDTQSKKKKKQNIQRIRWRKTATDDNFENSNNDKNGKMKWKN